VGKVSVDFDAKGQLLIIYKQSSNPLKKWEYNEAEAVHQLYIYIYIYIYIHTHLLTAIGLSPGGSSTVHIYTQTIHRTTQNKQHNNLRECGPCPVLARFTLAFALQLRK